jgi:hypothetical protein
MDCEVILRNGINMTLIGTILSEDGLEMHEWHGFYDNEHNKVRLTRYFISRKATKRHGWRVAERHDIYNKRDNNLDSIPFPPKELADKMLNTFKNSITLVQFWDI